MKRFTMAALPAATLVVVFAAVMAIPAFQPLRMPVDDVGEGGAAFVAAAACAAAAYRATGRLRLAWTLMGLSAGSWGAGQAIWTYYELDLHMAVPFPSWADAGFLAAMPFAFAAVVLFWKPGRGLLSGWRVVLDGTIVFLSLTFTAWALGLKAVWLDATDGDPLLRNFLEAAYPMGDLLVGTVLILGIRRATHSQQGRMLLLLGGIASYSLSDSAFSFLAARGGVNAGGSLLNAGWFAGYLLIALAAVWPATAVRTAERPAYDFWQLVLPWISVLAAGTSAFVLAITGRQLDLFLSALVGIGAILLTISMVLAQRDALAALRATQQSQATLAEVIARAPVGVVRIGPDLRLIDANPLFGSLMRANGSQAGRPVRSYFHGPEGSQILAGLRGLGGGAEATEGDTEARRGDGTSTWVHWSATAVEAPDGSTLYYVAMFEDTTARHEAEAAAAASLEVLERLNRLKSEFLQNVSHEFKTALLGIQGFSEFMRDADELNVEDVRGYAADIYSDAERLDRMVTEMLALDTVESSRAALRIERVELDAVIRREASAALEQYRDNPVVLNVQPNLPAVAGDEARLVDVVRALIENAEKRSPDGASIIISASASASGVEVGFHDEGVGARPEFDSRLLGQDDVHANSPIRKVVGTGLNLSIARRVVEMHGGRLWVDGGGTEFHFSIPGLWKDRAAAS